MKVYGVHEYKDMGDLSALKEIELPTPVPTGHDVLIQVKAVATNPIDYKALANLGKGPGPVDSKNNSPLVVGWDVAGVVSAVGPDVSLFKVGDEVMSAGDFFRSGAFGDLVVIDERIVGPKPKNLTWSQAAALPLTTLTAWEGLVDQLKVPTDGNKHPDKIILVTGGGGGVASATVEMAKNVFGMTVVATGSRPESIEYVTKLGADHVINHHKPFGPQLKELGIDQVDYVFDTHGVTPELFSSFVEITRAFGGILSIWPAASVDLMQLLWKSINFSVVLMFTRPTLPDAERRKQHEALTKFAQLVEAGTLTSKETSNADFNLDNLRAALEGQASGSTIGKRTLTMP